MSDGSITGTSITTMLLDYPYTPPGGSATWQHEAVLPFTLAGHGGNAAIGCGVIDSSVGAGTTLDVSASNASITAVQTTTNS